MDPTLAYIGNRRDALISAMAVAALSTMPRHSGTLRGSEDAKMERSMELDEPVMSEPQLKEIAGKALDTLTEGQPMTLIEGQSMTEQVLIATGWHIATQIAGQLGYTVAQQAKSSKVLVEEERRYAEGE